MQQFWLNDIYQSFLKKVGSDWVTPYNKNKFMDCGEFTICADLHEIGLMIRKKENDVFKFKAK